MVGLHLAMAASAVLGLGAMINSPAHVSLDLYGVKDRPGQLCVQIQTEEQFMTREAIAGACHEQVEGDRAHFDFDLAPGRYALSAWHDDNENGVFDRGDYGMPLDGWAMIGGAALRSAPSFAQNSFTVTEDGAQIDEYMVYGR